MLTAVLEGMQNCHFILYTQLLLYRTGIGTEILSVRYIQIPDCTKHTVSLKWATIGKGATIANDLTVYLQVGRFGQANQTERRIDSVNIPGKNAFKLLMYF